MANSKEFMYLAKYVIAPVRQTLEEECDPAFLSGTGLCYLEGKGRMGQLEAEFHRQRQFFKRQCYGNEHVSPDCPLLDSRKIAAVLCKTFLNFMPFYFDVETANQYAAEQRQRLSSEDYTKWAVNNTLINYKFAHLVGTQLVYLSLLSKLLEDKDTVEMGKKLNEIGHLIHYHTEARYDTLDTNIVVGLARADVDKQELNMMLYAMLLYQVEMHTMERLKAIVSKSDASPVSEQ